MAFFFFSKEERLDYRIRLLSLFYLNKRAFLTVECIEKKTSVVEHASDGLTKGRNDKSQ